MTHLCGFNPNTIGSDNGLAASGRQVIIWTNVGILLIGHLGTNFSEILIEIGTFFIHYNNVIMSAMASQIISLTIIYSTVYSGADQRKHQSSVSLAFVWGIHPWPVNSPHKGPVTRKMFPFDDVIISRKCIWKYHLENGGHFVSAPMF